MRLQGGLQGYGNFWAEKFCIEDEVRTRRNMTANVSIFLNAANPWKALAEHGKITWIAQLIRFPTKDTCRSSLHGTVKHKKILYAGV